MRSRLSCTNRSIGRARPRRRAGFSLFEIVLVLAIMATLTAIVAPRYAQAVARHRVAGAAWRIAAELERASAEARAASQTRVVSFDSTNQRLLVGTAAPLTLESASRHVALGDDGYRASITAVDFGGDHLLVFDGFGRPDSGGSVTLNCNGASRTVQFGATSARAEVLR